jgi:hypothetical protein
MFTLDYPRHHQVYPPRELVVVEQEADAQFIIHIFWQFSR